MEFVYRTIPWEHQIKALEYLYPRDAAALYTDMRTGKTKVMIDLIQNRQFKRVLVVAPNKACEVWEEQIQIHGLPSLFRVCRMNNLSVSKCIEQLSKDAASSSTDSTESDMIWVYIINYEKVWRKGLAEAFMWKRIGLDCVICDESHRIKTPSSNCSRYLARLGAKVPHRYLVTGTPLAESPTDIFAQYKFLDPTIFGTNFGRFRDLYENIDPVLTARIGHRILDKNNPYKNLEDLHEKMFSCAFWIESSVPLVEQTDKDWRFLMPETTEEFYHTMLTEKVAELNGLYMESSNALTTVLRLQQITSGFAVLENDATKEHEIQLLDHKRGKEFIEIMKQLPSGEPVVVFAVYRRDIKNIRIACKKLGATFSEVSGERDELTQWKNGETQVLITQYNAGSESIDLTRACHCIYYSMTRRLALYEQSRKRTHGPAQTRPAVYWHMIETLRRGTSIDEKMNDALLQKKSIVEYVIERGWE